MHADDVVDVVADAGLRSCAGSPPPQRIDLDHSIAPEILVGPRRRPGRCACRGRRLRLARWQRRLSVGHRCDTHDEQDDRERPHLGDLRDAGRRAVFLRLAAVFFALFVVFFLAVFLDAVVAVLLLFGRFFFLAFGAASCGASAMAGSASTSM